MAMVKQETGGKKKQTTATQTTKKAAAKSAAKSTTQSVKSAKSAQSTKSTTTTPAWDRTENPFPSVTTAKQLNTDYTKLQTARSNYKQAAQNVTDTRKAAQNEYVKLQSGQSTNELYKQTVLKALSAQSSFNQAEQTYNATRQSFNTQAGKYSGQHQKLLPGAAQSVLQQHSPETQRKKQQFSVASQQAAYNSAQKDNETRIKQIDEEIAQLDGEIQAIQNNPSAYSSPEHSTIVQAEKDISAISDKQKLLKAEKSSLQADNSVINDLRRTLPLEKSLLADPQFSYYSNLGRIKTEREYEEQRDLSTTREELNKINEPRNEITVGMTDTQRSVYYYFLGKGDTEEAKKYKEQIQSYINSNTMQDYTEKIQKIAEEHPGAASLASLGTNLMNDFASPLIYANSILGNDIDVNSPIYRASQATKILRSADGEKVADKFGSAGEFLYNTGMSMADSAIARAIGVGLFGKTEAAAKVTSAIMGSGAAVESISGAKNRGVSDEKALALGAIAGMAEYVTEKYSVETWLDKTTMDKTKLGYLVKNIISEGSEEGASDLINLFADILISKDKSEWEQSIVSYMAQGKSSSEAFGLAMGDQAAEMGLDVLGGAISGGVLAGGNLAINSAQNYAYDRALYHQAVENGKAYYNLNQLSGGELARDNGYMNIEQAYKTDPEARAEYERYQKNQQSEQEFSDEMEQLVKLAPSENEPSDSPAWQQYDAELARLENEWGADKINAYFGLQSDSSQSQSTAQQNNPLKTEGAESAQYSIDPDFANEVEAWSRSGQQPGKQFTLGSTGEVLQGLGAIESDIYMNSEKVTAILEKHPEMTLNEIKRLPEILDDPVLVLKSKGNDATGQNTRLVIFGSVKAQNGQPVLSVLDLRPMENKLVIDDMQKLTSAYTRNNLSSFLQSSDVLYADKKRTTAILRHAGLGSTGGVLRSGSLGSISYTKRNVNIQGTPFSQIFQTEESGAQYSIQPTTDGKQVVVIDTRQNIFDGKPQSEFPKIARHEILEQFRGKVFPLGENDLARITKKTASEYTHPSKRLGDTEYNAKARASTELDNLLATAEYLYSSEDKKSHSEATLGFDYFKTTFIVDGKQFEGILNIATSDEGRILYDITKIKESPAAAKVQPDWRRSLSTSPGDSIEESSGAITAKVQPDWRRSLSASPEDSSTASIPNSTPNVNPSSQKYSLRRSRNDVDPATFGRRTMRSRFAENETRRTGILSGVDESIITQAEQLSQAFGTQVVFDDTLARSKQGCYLNGTITLNANLTEEQVVRRVFGHELTHSVERTAAYQNLQSFVLSSIGNQTAVQNAINEKIELYRTYGIDLDRTKAINELVADFAAEHLFSDEQTVRRLTTQHQSLATRILNWIRKTLAKLTGNTEKTALLHAERLYSKALAQVQQSESGETARFSLRAFEDGKRFVRVDTDQHLFDGLTDNEKMKQAVKIIKNRFAGRVIGTENRVFVNGGSAEEFGHPAKHLSSDEVNAKMRASTELENLLDAGTNLRSKPDGENGHVHKDAVSDFEYLDVIFQVGDNYYKGTINIKNIERGRLLKDVTQIENVTQSLCSSYGQSPKSTSLRNISTDSIPTPAENVNTKYSIDPTFESELRQWDGKERKTFSVGTTSEALQSIGVEDRNIIWHSAKIAKILAKHSGMNIDVIAQVPNLLENPVVVTKSKNSDSRILLFGELTDSNGAPVTAVLELQPTSKGGELLDLNVIASAYGKDSNLASLIRSSEILYLDQNKNRTEAWLQNQGLISPLTEAVSDSENRTQEQKQGVRLQLPSDTNVLGSIGSISYANGNVNIQGTPFSQIFQTEESTPQYSIDPTADKTPAELEKENRKLQKQNERLAKENEQLTRQMTRTKPHTPSRSKLTGITDAFLTGYASRMDSDTLYDKLEDLYRCRTSGSATIGDVVIDYTEQNAKNDARRIAQELLESSEASPADLDAEVENLAKEILNRMTDVPDAAPTFADKKAAEFAREHAKRIRAEENEKKARAAERVAKSAAKTAEQRGAERERQRRAELDAKAQERKRLTELKDKLFQKLQWIRQNRHRAPEDLRTVFDAILNDINTYSKRQLDPNRYSERYGDTWNNVMNDYQQARKSGQILQNKEIEKLIARRDLQAIDTLDVSALEDLVEAAVMLQKDLQDRNRLLELDREMETDEAAKNIIHEMDNAVGKGRDQVVAMSRFKEYRTLWMLTPDHIFEWLSGWNKNSTLYQLGKTISTGERKMKDYKVRAERLMNDFVKEKGNRKWLRRADGQGKHGIWYELELQQYDGLDDNGNVIYGDTVTVYMTPMQKVHLYLESLNEDNLRHIQNGGRTFANRELYEDGQRQEAFAQGTTVRIEPEKVRSIVSDLTAEEKAYAELLSFYYNEFAAVQINHVSNILYGHDKAMTKSYAPIFTNSNYNSKEFGVFDRTVEGAGHLKERTYGGNPTLNIGASDAFDKHVAQTSRFVGLAIPLRNWKYVMNWQSKRTSLRDELTHHYGKKVLNYVEELLTDLESGGTQKQRGFWDKRLNSMLNNYITAVFGANPAIGLKQAASFPSFAAELGWKNLSIGLRNLPKVNEKLIDTYTSELAIRKMGYSTPEIATLKDNPGLLQRNKFLNVTFGGGHITAIDALTVKAGWAIAIEKVKSEYPNLEPGKQAQVENGESPFYQKVAEVWEEAVANTQPMYDTMHRAKIMKAETGVGRAFTLFKTVPVQTYNYVYQKFGELSFASKNLKRAQKSENADLIKGARKLKWKAAMGAAGALNSMIISNLALETVEFSMQLWKNAGKYYRDDDDELTAESVIEQILLDTFIDMAGSMPGADILVEAIANFLMQQTGSDLTSPGVEQFNEFMDQMNRIGTAVYKFIKEAEDIRRNGGDLGEFLKRSGGDYAGEIKDTIFLLAKYTSGLPLENVEKYVLGTVRIISPEMYAAIENFFDTTTKEDLAGLKGAQLTQTIHDTMETRSVTVNDKTVSALEKLYSAGYTAAIPSDTTSTIKLDEDSDEKVELSAYQKQVYDKKWSSVVNKGINELVTQKLFTQADEKTQAAMLNQLYNYAGEQAKHAVFSDYDGSYDIERAEQSVKYCKSVSLFAAWRGASSSATAEEKNNLIAQLPLTDAQKLQFYESEVKYNSSQSAIDTLEEQVKAVAEVGIGFDEYLKIATKKDSFEGKGENTRLEFTHWLDQTYTAEQAQAIKEALYAKPASYDKMITAGMDENTAYTLTTSLASIEPMEGKSSVSQTQKYAYIAFSPDYTSEEKRQAFTALLTDDEYAKYNDAWETAGISTEAYMDYKLTLSSLKSDVDENGKTIDDSLRKKVSTYINGIAGLTSEQKDYLYLLKYKPAKLSQTPWHDGTTYTGELPDHYNVTEKSVQRIMGTAATDTSTESGWAKSSKSISTRTGKSTASTSTKSATSTAYKSTSAATKSGLSSARSKTTTPKAATVSAPRTSLTVGSSKSKIKPLTISSYLNSFLPSPQAIGEENESSKYYI